MTGLYTINGTDVFTAYGLIFEPGTLDALMSPPARKESYAYAWKDQDGTERDTGAASFESREVRLTGIIVGADKAAFIAFYNAFKTLLTAGEYFTLKSLETGINWKLLYQSTNAFEFRGLQKNGTWVARITLNLVDDFPTEVIPDA